MSLRLICAGIAFNQTWHTFEVLVNLLSQYDQRKSLGRAPQQTQSIIAGEDEEENYNGGSLFPLNQIKRQPESRLVNAWNNLDKISQFYRDNLVGCLASQLSLLIIIAWSLTFFQGHSLVQAERILELFSGEIGLAKQIIFWLPITILAKEEILKLFIRCSGGQTKMSLLHEYLTVFTILNGLTFSCYILTILKEYSPLLKALDFDETNFRDFWWNQRNLTVFLAGLKLIIVITKYICIELNLKYDKLFEQEMVNGIASQLFEDDDGQGSTGYAVLELSGELERFRLTRFNNRFIEQLKGSEPVNDRGDQELSTAQQLSNILSSMESPAYSMKEGKGETASFPELFFNAIMQKQSETLIKSEEEVQDSQLFSRIFMLTHKKEKETHSSNLMVSRSFSNSLIISLNEKRLKVTITVLCQTKQAYLLKVIEEQVPQLKFEKISYEKVKDKKSQQSPVIFSKAKRQNQQPRTQFNKLRTTIMSYKRKSSEKKVKNSGEPLRKQSTQKLRVNKKQFVKEQYQEKVKNMLQRGKTYNYSKFKQEMLHKVPKIVEEENQLLSDSDSNRNSSKKQAIKLPQFKLINIISKQKSDNTSSLNCKVIQKKTTKVSFSNDKLLLVEEDTPLNKPIIKQQIQEVPEEITDLDCLNLQKQIGADSLCSSDEDSKFGENKSPQNIISDNRSTFSAMVFFERPSNESPTPKAQLKDKADLQRQYTNQLSMPKNFQVQYDRRQSLPKSNFSGYQRQYSNQLNATQSLQPLLERQESMTKSNQSREFKSQIEKMLLPKRRVTSQSSMKSLLSAKTTFSEVIRNNQTFVYKIIHDMRHPTIALTEGLEILLKQEKLSQLKLRSHFTKNFHFKSSEKVSQVLKICKTIHRNSLRASIKDQRRSIMLEFLNLKEEQKVFEEPVYRQRSQSLNPVTKSHQLKKETVTDLKQAVGNLQQQFWNIPLNNFAEKKKEEPKTPEFQINLSKQRSYQPYEQQIPIELASSVTEYNKSPQIFKDERLKLKKNRHKSQIQTQKDELQSNDQSSEAGSNIGTQFISRQKLVQVVLVLLSERKTITELLQKSAKQNVKTTKQMKMMLSQAQMTLSLLKDLMNQAQLRNNTFTMENEYFDLIKLVRSCLRMVASQSRQRKVNIVGPVLVDSTQKIYFRQIWGDLRRYSQIIVNFLSNSVKFTKEDGTVSVHLSVTSIRDDNQDESNSDRVLSVPDKEQNNDNNDTSDNQGSSQRKPVSITVSNVTESEKSKESNKLRPASIQFKIIFRDTGVGIAKNDLEKLFMNFSKLDRNRNQNKQGVGLGLSICKEIIMANGGKINVESELGQGTDFIIDLEAKCQYNKNDQKLLNQESSSVCSLSEDEDFSKNSSQSSSIEIDEVQLEQILRQHTDQIEVEQVDTPSTQFVNYRKQRTMLTENLNLQEIEEQSSVLYDDDSEISSFKSKKMLQYKVREKPRCLLANDAEFLLLSFKAHLQSHKIEVDTACDGLIALQKVQKYKKDHYQFIILDINMPIMGGIEAYQKIQQHFAITQENPDKSHPDSSNQIQVSELVISDESSTRTRLPKIYALTSDTDPQMVQHLRDIGFSDISSNKRAVAVVFIVTNMDESVIKQMVTACGYEFKANDDFESSCITSSQKLSD